MGGSMSIRNDTDQVLIIQLKQVGVLYHQKILPGQIFYKETGAVHFTIQVRVYLSQRDLTDIYVEGVLPVAKFTSGAVVLASTAIVAVFQPELVPATAVSGTQIMALSFAPKQKSNIDKCKAIFLMIRIMRFVLSRTFRNVIHGNADEIEQMKPPVQLVVPEFNQNHLQLTSHGWYSGYKPKLRIIGGIVHNDNGQPVLQELELQHIQK